MIDFGLDEPNGRVMFILTGTMERDKVVKDPYAGMLIMAWRCLYAAITKGRIEKKEVDFGEAMSRWLLMLNTRATAFGEKWRIMHDKTARQNRTIVLPRRARDKVLVKIGDGGEYEVHGYLMSEAKRLQKAVKERKRRARQAQLGQQQG